MKRNVFLRVKIKSLAEEARIIRREERIANKQFNFERQQELYLHRVNRVRPAARATLLAYQYLRGKPYSECEAKLNEFGPLIDWKAVKTMVKRYGHVDIDVDKWIAGDCLKQAA